MNIPNGVDFTRYVVPIEICFVNGKECCEWCSCSFTNMKRHYECKLTGEEMVSPKDSIGFKCPIRKLYEE